MRKLLEVLKPNNWWDPEGAIVIAQYDKFRLIQEEDNWIHLEEGEGNVRVSMPVDIWDRLISNYLEQGPLNTDQGNVKYVPKY